VELKTPFTYEQQVEQLRNHGMEIVNIYRARTLLTKINYYRFSGYALQYRKAPEDSDYMDGTTFDSVYKVYQFDAELRSVLRKYIEIVEIYFRAQISYGFSMAKCLAPPHDQHYDENNFYRKKEFNEVISNLERDKNYYKDSLIVKHHKSKYNSKMPLWVMVELLSFSDISKLFGCMYNSEQYKIADKIGISASTLENHLHCLSVLRNKCAHAARLYNTKFYPPVKFNAQFLRTNPEVKNTSLFAYILVLLKRLPDKESKDRLINEILSLVDKFHKDVELARIGFPSNYVDLIKKQVY